jgi:SAM-dependent methyltransferase
VVTPANAIPDEFFRRIDESDDGDFYASDRLVTHIDDRAITAVGALYQRLDLHGRVLDLMSSWISHFVNAPNELVVLGMNARELDANPMATGRVTRDLNTDPTLPFDDERFDAVTCCVSVDYLTRPIEVFREVRRVLAPSGVFVCTFSNRCFPTKAIRGWLDTDDAGHCRIVSAYFAQAGGFDEATVALCTPSSTVGDPLYAVWARRAS